MSKIPMMIVDDDEVDRYLLNRYLLETGLDVEIYERSDGQTALDFFTEQSDKQLAESEQSLPMVIFLDINMPLIDGFGFLKGFDELRSKVDLSTCVIMMFSSSERPDDREKAFSFDFVKDYLVKGKFDSKALKEKIVEHVKKAQSAGAS